MPDSTYYKGLITSQHSQKANFIKTVETSVDPFVNVQESLREVEALFDVNTAVGNNLDAVGLWVGVSRNVPVPIAGTFFSWADTAATGWGVSSWLGAGNSATSVTSLNDDEYRQLIKGKIAANTWDGSIPGAYDTLAAAFGMSGNVTITDNQNMSQTVTITGGTLTATQRAMLTQGLIPIKPAGVQQFFVEPATAPYDTFIYRPGVMVASQVVSRTIFSTRTFYATRLEWAQASLTTGPTASRTYSIILNGTTTVGTLTFAAGSTIAVVDIISPDESILLIPGNIVEIITPAVVDAVATDLYVSFLGWLA